VPGEGLNIPIYLLGSSDFSARLAAARGLPFGFASHFAPDFLTTALRLYRSGFTPSEQLHKPYVIVGANLFAADTDAEAQRLFTSLQQAFVNLVRGSVGPLPAPIDSMDGRWNAMERQHVEHMLHYSVVGSRETIREQLTSLLELTQADELIFTAQIHDHAARLRSFEIGAEVMSEIGEACGAK
jgi:luciferase family oxidoreductase group 1